MIINFLQRRNPPVLPSLQKIATEHPDCCTRLESGELSDFADDIEAIKRKGFRSENKETIGELLFQFFRHYGYEFEYSKYVVCVREGRAITRESKGWDPKRDFQDKESRVRLCVEEPFTKDRNLGNSADDYAWYGIHQEIRRAFDLLADGLQLTKCCEEFVFPPEQPRTIFERPKPQPKPTLRRSVSQTNRTIQEQGTGRSRKNNRQTSGQRAGNRRASSGAAYSHHRPGLPFSPPPGGNPNDYFQLKGNLHEQLFQQYAFLQAQQDALRQQLERQSHNANAARGGDLAGSPRPRQYANGLASPRLGDHPPQSAPLLPGYLYHYPGVPRYPPPSPMSQARQVEGINTNPSSPSLVAAMPARRTVHRSSVPDASASSARSQSQPGRSLPHPLTFQQHVHPGYDVSGALGNYRAVSQLHAGHPGLQLPLSAQFPGVLDSTQPKEYIGYFSSPQLGPQHFASASQIPPPAMTLRDPPTHRQRRVTPDDLAPPIINGRQYSRSPSPLSHPRGLSVQGDLDVEPATIVQSPSMNGQLHSGSVSKANKPSAPVMVNGSTGGPVIVNGSTRNTIPKPAEQTLTNGVAGPGIQLQNEAPFSLQSEDMLRYRPMQIRTDFEQARLERRASDLMPPGEGISPTQKPMPDARATLSPNGVYMNGINGHHGLNPVTPPMLSPVVELPTTPSPTHARGAFNHESPKMNGLLKNAKVADAKHVMGEKHLVKPDGKVGQEHKGSAPAAAAPAKTAPVSRGVTIQEIPPYKPAPKNEWQTAPGSKSKHKKSKSTASTKAANGQILPPNDFERKGG